MKNKFVIVCLIIFNYNGLAQNENGWWYIKNGKVDFSNRDDIRINGKIYKVFN